MTALPEPQQPTAPTAGQNPLEDAIIQAAVENAIHKARRTDTTPEVVIGNALPVPQPGIPPQSRAAVDYAVRMLSTGVATALCSGGVALVLAASQAADPVVCGLVFGAPVGLAVPIAALAGLLKRAKPVLPDVHHHHYNGNVDQSTITTHARGVWVKSRTDVR